MADEADETDDTDATEDEARQARHAGVAVAATVLSRVRRPVVWAVYCAITINDKPAPS